MDPFHPNGPLSKEQLGSHQPETVISGGQEWAHLGLGAYGTEHPTDVRLAHARRLRGISHQAKGNASDLRAHELGETSATLGGASSGVGGMENY